MLLSVTVLSGSIILEASFPKDRYRYCKSSNNGHCSDICYSPQPPLYLAHINFAMQGPQMQPAIAVPVLVEGEMGYRVATQ